MAYALLASPGKVVNGIEIGPCVEECVHIDCAQTRTQAAKVCHFCGKPIGYETEFQKDNEDRLVHFWCAVDAHETDS